MTIQTATATRLDEATATAIRNAFAAARMGRLGDACVIAERGLAAGGDRVAINALLGMFRFDLEEYERAVDHLELAHEGCPSDIKITTNLAGALIALERFDRAFEVVSRELAFADPTLQLARMRGFVADQLKNFTVAVEALEHVVAAEPDDWETWNNLGNARHGAMDWEGSVAAHKRAVEINPTSVHCRLNYATALRGASRFEEAEAAFHQMAEEFPEDVMSLRELYLMLKDIGRDEDSLEAIAAAVERDPTNIELLIEKASVQSSTHQLDAAEATYRTVIGMEPCNATAYLGLALMHELNNRTDQLRALVQEAEACGVDESWLRFIRAYHYRRTKQFDLGLAELKEVPAELETGRRLHLLAQLLDGAGRYDEAFETFSRMNELSREDLSMPEERAARYRNSIRDSLRTVTDEWVGSWRAEVQPDSIPSPVFLVGFPRSGTTLLDTILMGHPGTEVLEEEPPLRKAHALLNNLTDLPKLSDEEIRLARDAYFDCAAALTPLAPGNLLIDKNPLTMNLLPLVRRLFPDAKVILALRHPCDVVLSCFMANFRLNDGMANFVSLDTAAELYDLSFRYYEHVQSLMPMPTATVVYEKIVGDRESELRKLFDFLDLDWHDAVLDHQTTAQKRGRIKTASYSQVVEPIYTRAAGRWQKYRKHLEPILPVLQPWAEKFGYSI